MNPKIKSIIRHEYFTIIKQPAFILTMLGIPLLMIAIGAISFFSERTAESNLDEITSDLEDIVIVDASGLINPNVVESLDFEFQDANPEDAIERVKSQEISGAIIYPENTLQERTFSVYIDGGDDFLISSAVSDIGSELLETSLILLLDDENIATILRQGADAQVTAYQDGEKTAGAGEYVVPGAFLVLFFIILFFTMGYMLLGVAEEKENRSMEMVLSYVRPRTLMSGKLLGIGLVGLTQMLFFISLGVISYFAARRFESQLGIPLNIDLSALAFDPLTIIIGFFGLILGFLFFAALMSGVAAMAPGVKEANSFSSVFFLIPFVPFYAFPVILAAPESVLVRLLTFFPVTSPPVILLRNTLGNIEPLEAILATVVLGFSTVLAFMLSAKLFRLGALEFADRVKISSIFK